jgi:hypothetical protein
LNGRNAGPSLAAIGIDALVSNVLSFVKTVTVRSVETVKLFARSITGVLDMHGVIATLVPVNGNIDFSIEEPRQWQVLVLRDSGIGNRTSDEGTNAELTLDPVGGTHFNAVSLPSFRLLTVTLTGSNLLDSEGHLKEEVAFRELVSATTDEDAVRKEVLSTIVAEKSAEIGAAIAQDSAALSTLLGDERRTARSQQIAADRVSATLSAGDASDRVAEILKDDPQVKAMLEQAMTSDKVKGAIVEAAVANNQQQPFAAADNTTSPVIAAVEQSGVSADASTETVTEAATAKTAEIAAAIASLHETSIPLTPSSRGGRGEQLQTQTSPLSSGEGARGRGLHEKGGIEGGGVIQVKLKTKDGKSFSPKFHFEQGSVILVLEPEREFVPGLYTAEVTVTNPLTNESQTLTQDFAWGVLAMNTNQDRYEAGDKAQVAIGVLDDEGEIICDAKVGLSVTAPGGEVTELSTTDQSVRVTGICGKKDSMNIIPDYEAFFSVTEPGTYVLKLTAETENGVREMTQTIAVRGNPSLRLSPAGGEGSQAGVVTKTKQKQQTSPLPTGEGQGEGVPWPIVINRKAATRLYPFGPSPMEITVKFNEDFKGTVTETVPGSFEVKNPSLRLSPDGREGPKAGTVTKTKQKQQISPLPAGEGQGEGVSEQTISWQGSWSAGDTAVFSYIYDAPDVSPEFFLMGPLVLRPHPQPFSSLEEKGDVCVGCSVGASVTEQNTNTNKNTNNSPLLRKGEGQGVRSEWQEARSWQLANDAQDLSLTLWAKKRKITISNSNVDEDLTDFPLSVKITADADIGTLARSDGYDIRFATTTGALLSYEREEYHVSSGSGSGVFWVKIPRIDADTDTDFYIYYGRKDAGDGSSASSVWDSNFKGVWHLSGATLSVTDSTGLNTTTNTGFSSTNGKIDGAGINTTTSGGNNISAGDVSALNSAAAFTIDSWVKFTAFDSASGINAVISKGSIYNYGNDLLLFAGSDGTLTLQVDNGSDGGATGSVLSTNTWYHIISVFDGSQTGNANRLKVWLNGQQEVLNFNTFSVPATTAAMGGSSFTIGNYVAAGNVTPLHGALDELRISNIARSAAWIKFEYNNMNSAGQELTWEGTGTSAAEKVISGWPYKKKFTVSAGNVDENLSNFPLYVKVRADSDLGRDALSTGYDIRFTTSTGVLLPYEREQYHVSSGSGSGDFWVKVPFLSATTDTDLYMYYGLAGAADGSESTNVWDSSYKGVWHLNETATDEATTADLHLDSTSNNNDGDQAGNADAGGQVAIAQDFDGTDDYVGLGNPATLEFGGTAARTISAWVNTDTVSSSWLTAVSWDKSEAGALYRIQLDDTASPNRKIAFAMKNSAGADQVIRSSSAVSAGTWYHVAGVYNGTQMVLYLDGAQSGTPITMTPITASLVEADIGSHSGHDQNWNGKIDEPRISSVARSAAWIKFEYQNMASASNEITWETKTNTLDGWTLRKPITISKTNVDSTLTDFPLYVKIRSDADLGTSARGDGYDIRFATSTGVILPYEREDYHVRSGSGAGDFWVKVPQVSATANTLLYMYYGKADAADGATSDESGVVGNVWDSNFVGVWHLGQTSSGALSASDSTSNGNNGGVAGATASGGKIDGGGGFDGTDDYVLSNSSYQINANQELTLSAWIKIATDQNGLVVGQGYAGNCWGGYMRYSAGGSIEFGNSAADTLVTGAAAVGVGVWTHVAIRVDSTTAYGYVNGSYSTSTVRAASTCNERFFLGTLRGASPTMFFSGQIDEVRISNAARSAAWVKFEYQNMASATNEITIGSGQSAVITGTAYADRGGVPLAGKTVRIAVNGTDYGDTAETNAAGQFVMSGASFVTGDVLSLYLEDETQDAVTVMTASGGSMTGIDLYQDTLIIRSDSGGTVTNTQLSTAAVSGETDISGIYTVDAGILNVKSGKNLLVWANRTFTPGGNVNVGSGVILRGTFTLETNTATLSGAWIKQSTGTYTSGSGTVILDGTNQTLSGSTTFWNLTKSVTSAYTLSIANGTTQTVAGTLTLNGNAGGVLRLRSSADGSQWNLNLRRTQNLSYLDVKDSNAAGAGGALPLDVSDGNSVDSGNNIYWGFGWYGQYTNRKLITIDQTNVDSDLTDFPLLVAINADASLGSYAQLDGDDIRFTTTAGAPLYYEREDYRVSSGSGSGNFWVKVPVIDDTVDTTIYVYYGSGSAADGQSAANVWDSSYAGVWHGGDGVTLSTADSTANANNGTNYGATAATGVVGGGAGIDGVAGHYIDLNYIPPSEAYTISMWFNRTAVSTEGLFDTGGAYVRWTIVQADDNSSTINMNPSLPSEEWGYFSIAMNAGILSSFLNGNLNGAAAWTLAPSHSVWLGSGYSRWYAMTGTLDEVRISSTARSAEWIKFEYANSGNSDHELGFGAPDGAVTWDGGGSTNNCSEAANWDGNSAPTATGDVIFNSTSVKNVTWDAGCPSTVKSLSMNAGYTGTGTLAGTITVTNNLTINSGSLVTAIDGTGAINVGGDFTMGGDATLVVRRWKTTGGGSGQTITVSGNLTVGTGAVITADGRGFAAGAGPGAGWAGSGCGDRGASHGGKGGTSNNSNCVLPTYGSITAPTTLGSGGYGSSGGGAIVLTVGGSATVFGTITANAYDGNYAPGAGGSVFLSASSLAGNGTLRANGGNATISMSGGGGRVAAVLTSGNSFDGVTMQAYGGETNTPGAAGTVYQQTASQSAGHGTLIIDNNQNATTGDTSTLMPPNTSLSNFASVTIRNRGELGIASNGTVLNFGTATINGSGTGSSFVTIYNSTGATFPNPYTLSGYTLRLNAPVNATGDWTISSTGNLSHSANNDGVALYFLNVTLSGDLTVAVGGRMNADGKGYKSTTGPGKGNAGGGCGDYGASYGGEGGITTNRSCMAATYGSITAPTALGSGGYSSSGGGSVVITVSGAITMNGIVSVNGANVNFGASAGGSVFLTAASLSGNGSIKANGGMANISAGGGGGRISVILTSGNSFGIVTMQAYGGAGGSYPGAAGTVYEQTASQGAGHGNLIIDNDSLTTSISLTDLNGYSSTGATVGSITLQNKGNFRVGPDDTLTIAGTGTTVTVNANSTLTNSGALSLGGEDFTINGTFSAAGSGTVTYTAQAGSGANVIATTYKNLVTNRAGSTFRLAGATTANGSLTVSGGTLDVNGSSLTANSTFTVQSGATLKLQGGETVTTPTLNNGSTVAYNGTSGPYTLKTWNHKNLTILGTGATFNLPATTTLTGSLTLTRGTLDATASNYDLYVSGNWTKNGGAFNARAGTVNLTGTNQTMSGSTSFYNLTKQMLAAELIPQLTFAAGTTQTVTGALVLNGAVGNLLSLKSSVSGSRWNLNPLGSLSLSYLDLKDSKNLSAPMDLQSLNCTDSGNNIGWGFGWYWNWPYRKKITISHANVDSDLTNFPLYVKINQDALIGSRGKSDGTDLRFTDSNGAALAYERENYSVSSGSGSGNFWVKVPSIAADSDTDIYVYYGSGSAADGQDRTGVWDGNFKGVWHAKEGASNWADSTSNGNTGTNNGATAATGTIDGSGNFNGTNSYIALPSSSVFDSLSTLTISAWIRPDTNDNHSKDIVVKRTSLGNDEFEFRLNSSNTMDFDRYLPSGGSAQGDTIIPTDQWSYVASILNDPADQVIFYLNGENDGTRSYTESYGGDTSSTVTFGRSGVSSADGSIDVWRHFDGLIDEVRISSTARSPSWIKFEYNNMNSANQELTWEGQVATTSITGTVYSDEGTTALGSQTVRAAVNGVDTTATAESDPSTGAFTLSGVPTGSGNIVTLYLEDETADAVTVTVGSGGNLSGIDLYQNHLVIRSSNGTQITNSGLATAAVVGETDISNIYSVTGNNLATADGKALYSGDSGTTFVPGGDVNVGSGVTIQGTMNLGTNTLTLSGTFLKQSNGVFTISNSTVILDGTNQTLSGSTTFYNLTKSVTAASTLTIANGTTQTVAGTLTLNGNAGGVLRLRSSADGSQWNLYPSGTVSLDYLDIKDGNNTANSVSVTNSTDSGNNDRFGFGWYKTWTNRKAITIDQTNVDADLTDFPLLVALSADTSIGTYAQSDGSDLRFTDSLGAPLRYEKEDFRVSSGSGSGNFWVKVPVIDDAVDTTIYVYYGNASASDVSSGPDTFSEDFAGVWHGGDGVTLSAQDSSPYGNHGTNYGATAAAGVVGGAGDFRTTGWIQAGIVNYPTSFPISCGMWLKADAMTGYAYSGVFLSTADVSAGVQFGFNSGFPYYYHGGAAKYIGSVSLRDGAWHQLSVVFESASVVNGYVDGNPVATDQPIGGWPALLPVGTIGSVPAGGLPWNGFLDDPRISSTARSAAWIKFEYANSGNSDHEISFGGAQTTISGTAYSDEGVTPLASQTVRLAINGVDGGTTETNASGQYTLSGTTLAAGDILTLYLEDETADAVTVTNSSGTSLTGINLYQNRLITRSDNSSPLTNANLATAAVSGETDISGIYAVSAGALTVASGKTLFTGTGQTLAPGGNVTAGAMKVYGTYNQGSNALTVNGNFTQSNGTFNGGSAAITISNSGVFNLFGGTFTSTTDTFTVDTDFTKTGGTFASNSGTVLFVTRNTGTLNSQGSITFYNATFNAMFGQVFYISNGSAIINGTTTLTNGSVSLGTLNAKGPISVSSTFDGGTTTLLIDGSGDQSFTIPNGVTVPGVTLNNSNTTVSFAADANATMVGNLTIQAGTFISTNGTLSLSGGPEKIHTVTVSGGTFNHNSGTISVTAGWNNITFASDISVNNLSFSTVRNINVNSGKNVTVNGTLNVNQGFAYGPGTIIAKGSVIVGSSLAGGNLPITMSGSSAQTLESEGGTWPSGTFTINKPSGAVTLSGALTLNTAGQDLAITSGTLNLNGNNLTVADQLTIASAGTLRLKGSETVSAIDTNNGTVNFSDSATYSSLAAGNSYQNLSFSGSGLWKPNAALTVSGNLTVGTGSTFDVHGKSTTVTGTFENAGTLALSGDETTMSLTNDTDSGLVDYVGTGSYTGLKAGNSYHDVTFNGAGGTWTLNNALTVNGDLALTAGTLDASATNYGISVAGDWTKTSGAFTARGGTVTLNGTNQSIAGSTTFYNLTKQLAAELIPQLTFAAGTTQTVAGTLTLNGAANNLLSLRSTVTGTQWNINPQGTRTVSYLDVQDSNNTNATLLACATGCATSGNNTNWGNGTTPAISSVASTPTSTGALIAWTSDPAGSTRVEYGPMTNYGALTPETDTSPRVTNHEKTISDLVSCVTYHYRSLSKDEWEVQGASADQTFQTTGCPASTTIIAQSGAVIASTNAGTVALEGTGTGITLTVPENASAEPVLTYQINQLVTSTVLGNIGSPTDMNVVGDVYQLTALVNSTGSVTEFDEPLTVAIQYTAAEIDGIDETTLGIRRHDGTNWHALDDCVTVTAVKTVTCTTTQFSTFGLFGSPLSTGAGGGAARTRELLQELGFLSADGSPLTETVTETPAPAEEIEGIREAAPEAQASSSAPTVVRIEVAPTEGLSPSGFEGQAEDLGQRTQETATPSPKLVLSEDEGSQVPDPYTEGVILPYPPRPPVTPEQHEEQVAEVKGKIQETIVSIAGIGRDVARAVSATFAGTMNTAVVGAQRAVPLLTREYAAIRETARAIGHEIAQGVRMGIRPVVEGTERMVAGIIDGTASLGRQMADGGRLMGRQIADGGHLAGMRLRTATDAGLTRAGMYGVRVFPAATGFIAQRVETAVHAARAVSATFAGTMNTAVVGAQRAVPLLTREYAAIRETARAVTAWRDGVGRRVEHATERMVAGTADSAIRGTAAIGQTISTVVAWRNVIGTGVERAAGLAAARGAGTVRDTVALGMFTVRRGTDAATDLVARGFVTTQEGLALTKEGTRALIARGRSILQGIRSPQFASPTQIAEKSAAPEPSERKYRTALTKQNGKLLIASLNLSVMDSLGNPYRQTPVVLFSTPKIATTDDEGIATFHEVETGKHRIEIHVKEGQIETKEIILEPPSGLTVEEQQRLDVLLPVVNVVVNEPLRSSALDLSGIPLFAWILISLAIGLNALLGFALYYRNHNHNH